MSAYLLGLATLPALAGAAWLLTNACGFTYYRVMKPRGYSIELKTSRSTAGISDYVRRTSAVWEERQRGPIFTGLWRREESGQTVQTRWLGIGRANGRSVMFFHITQPATTTPTTSPEQDESTEDQA